MHISVSSFIHIMNSKKQDSQWALTWSIAGTLFCIFFVCSNCWLGLINYNIHLKLWKNSACIIKTYFLLKTFSARLLPSGKSIFPKFLQKYNSSILNMLNIDESSLQIQKTINILGQFHSSLCRKQLFCN